MRLFSGTATVAVLATVALLCGVAHQVAAAAVTGHDAQVENVVERVYKLTHDAVGLEQKINARINWKKEHKGGSLEARVDAVSDPSCQPGYFQCGGNDPQCVSNLLVCDHRRDCRNGEDEKHCEVPVKKGDRFVGDKIFDKCGMLNPDHITVVIDEVTTLSFFTGFPRLKITIKIEADSDESDKELSIPAVGFYNTGSHQMVFQSSTSDNVALVGQFDGHDFDHFVGESLNEGSRQACARYVYKRQ